MMQLLKTWFKGLFTSRTKAQGLSSEPTYSQVERLIEAAGGASAKGGSLYSKPTYSQFERLIAALGGGSGSGSGSVSGLPAKRDKLDLGVYDFMPETWEVSGSKALFSGGTYTWDDASSQWRLSNGQRSIRAKAGASNTYQLVFDPGTAGELAVCEWVGTATQDVPFTHGGESWAVTVEGRGNAGLKPTGDTLVKKSEVPVQSVKVGSKSVTPSGGVLTLPVTNSATSNDGNTLASAKAVKNAADAASAARDRLDAAKRAKDDLAVYAYPVTLGYWTVGEGESLKTYQPASVFPQQGVYKWSYSSTDYIQYSTTTGNVYRKLGDKAVTFGTQYPGKDPTRPETTFPDNIELLGDLLMYHPTVVGSELAPTDDTLATGKAVDAKFDQAVTTASYNQNYTGFGLTNKPAILLKHDGTVLAAVDASAFVVDGMVEDVYIGDATSGPEGTQDEDESGKLVIKFNTDAGAKVIRIPLAKIFNPDNYPTKSYVDTTFVEKGATSILIGSGASKANNVTNAVVIGVNASANGSTTSSAVAIGTEAKAKKTGAVQLGAGENSEEKSLQFRGTKVVGGDGKIPETSLHYVPALESVPEQTVAASTSYAVGAVVVDSGKAYRCKSAYKSAATPESPSVDTGHWTEVPVLAGKESASNKVTSLTSESTDEQYPSAKCVYDALNGAGAKPTRLYNENGADALDDKGQLFDSVVETGGHWEVDVVDNMGYNTGHYVYTYVGIVNGMHRWSQGGSTSATDRNIQISGDQVSWYSQFRFKQKVTSGVDPTSTSGSESMAGTYTGSDSRHSVTAVYVPQRPQIQSDPYAHFALESLPDRTWVAGKWAVGDLVKHDGKAYRCKAAAKLSDTTAPSSDTTHWTEVPVLTGVTQLFAGRSLPQAPTQNEVAEVVKEIFKALGGTISTTSSNDDNP